MRPRPLPRTTALAAWLAAITLLAAPAAALAAKKVGIFQEVLETPRSFAETTAALEKAIAGSSLELIGKADIAVPDDAQKARVYCLTSPAFNRIALATMAPDEVSALILRAGVYEAYGKVHVNIANPEAIANVYFADEKQRDALISAALAAKQELIRVIQSVPGIPKDAQQEPIRKLKKYRGYNGDGPAKMMAKFRDFRESLLTVKEVDGSVPVDRLIEEIKANAARSVSRDPEKGWHVVAVKRFSDDLAWVGILNRYTGLKCIKINSDFRFKDKKEGTKYPGVDHTPAMPMELVLYKKDGKWRIAQYGEMWRMQLYFWDSGYAAFAKNTLIPSIIFGDIEKLVKGE
ncbi:MAG: hypothetical protein D6739_03715 [Nitrospirae bacterium]|nr:MAG: hypothetical protein D6739_03715 [Nitrospirota bacterium]